jgi:hypothetical protein
MVSNAILKGYYGKLQAFGGTHGRVPFSDNIIKDIQQYREKKA